MTTKKEQEVKIQPQANLQFKYTNIATPEAFSRRAESLLRIIGLEATPMGTKAIVDNYYDFADYRLHRAGYSLRMRRGEDESGTCKVTLKSLGKGAFSRGMQRDETEILLPEKRRKGSGPNAWKTLIGNPGKLFAALLPKAPFPTNDRLAYLGSVHNDRSRIDFSTRMGTWRMSYDRFYYFRGEYDDSSEFTRYFSEVEIELLSGDQQALQRDKQLMRIVEAFAALFGMEESRTTKLDRGMQCEWGSEAEVEHVYVVGFDIVGYSTRAPAVQLQLIQKLNKWVKDSLSTARQKRGVSPLDKFTVYIPTGDGMYVVFDREEDATLIPDLLARVLQKVKEFNRMVVDDEKSIHCRIGVHAGPVFKYSDINEDLNFAGNGLNLGARVLNRAGTDQVLVSVAAKMFLETLVSTDKALVRLGEFVVKHEVALEMWNYYDRHNRIGISHEAATRTAKSWR
ncbi:MAG TPA: CYTH domain-containing protein [Chthoniobacterales bacterium]|nr:CYTH domain-containing protein [Chthoniobacterales bacterium]